MNLEAIINPSLKTFMYQGETYENHTQLLFRFPNDYGASVICGYGTGVELAKIFFDDDCNPDEVDYVLVDEPVGFLERDELNYLLNNIKGDTK